MEKPARRPESSDVSRGGSHPDLTPTGAPLVSRRTGLKDLSQAVVLIDKPGGVTSHDVVKELRRLSGTRKVGHAGTLDPMATGLLICLTGRCTRLSRYYLELEKEYVGTLRLGQTTASYDADTPVEEVMPAGDVTREAVVEAAGRLLGEIIQMTPAYSAVRIQGEPLYRRARRGELKTGPPRIVSVYAFEVQSKRGDEVDFRVVCSKGTYVRSLVHEVGVSTGVGAHLTRLRRVRIGQFRVEDALRPAELRLAAEDEAGDDGICEARDEG